MKFNEAPSLPGIRLISSIVMLLLATASTASAVNFVGAIGPYQIEAELDRSDGRLMGRYRYSGRDAWIALAGEAFGTDAMRLDETVDDNITGRFYLEAVGQGLQGFWVNEASDFEAHLTPVTGVTGELFAPIAQPEVNAALTGQYAVGGYWVNDWFAPRYEIGFNGGEVSVVEVTPNMILVGFEFIVGPTYHFATFLGHATLAEDRVYIHDAVLPGGELNCRLAFHFEGTQLSIEDNGNGFACQFGARAHANFDLRKISDTAEFKPPW